MLVTKITPNCLTQNNINNVKKQQYYKTTDSINVSVNFTRTVSFGGIKTSNIMRIFHKEKPSLTGKTYKLFGDSLFIGTSTNTALGQKPVLYCRGKIKQNVLKEFVRIKNEKKSSDVFRGEIEMKQEGDNYYARLGNFLPDEIKYEIFYKDTYETDDNNGKGYEINFADLINKVSIYDKKAHNQPMLRISKKGFAQGRVIIGNTLTETLKKLPNTDEPLILVVDKFGDHNFDVIPPNIRGVIFTKMSSFIVGHQFAYTGSLTDACAMVFDEKQIHALKKMEGKIIDIAVNPKKLKFRESKISKQKAIIQKNIVVPEITVTNKLLTSDEYTPEIAGPKAYNLHRMEEMKKKGKLKDVIIPHSFGIPSGVFDETLAANPENAKNIKEIEIELDRTSDLSEIKKLLSKQIKNIYSLKIPEKIQQDIINFIDKCGLSKELMIRSAFNGEDIKGYSAAGLYYSHIYVPDRPISDLFSDVNSVWDSKWYDRAYFSRKRHNIAHNKIKPTVLIQDRIDADYRFTAYTKDPESKKRNKILIEMRTRETIDPYIIRYDKSKKEVEIEAIGRKERKIIFDDQMRVISADPIDDPIMKNIDKWKHLLKKVCNAALEVEEEFGNARDIEGGIKLGTENNIDDAQIYFWQTRDQII